MKSKMMIVLTSIVIFIVGASFTTYQTQEPKPWPVPDKSSKMANPVKSDASSISSGKELWAKHCMSCHGKTGKGDGTKAAQLETKPGDFSTAATQSQTDGSLFYKIAKGRGDMPGYKKKIPENDDIWSVVNFIRTLKK